MIIRQIASPGKRADGKSMRPGENGSRGRLVAALLAGLLAGCAARQPCLDRALMAEQGFLRRGSEEADSYLVACPDVLDVTADGPPELNGLHAIGPDGCIALGDGTRLRVEGRDTV